MDPAHLASPISAGVISPLADDAKETLEAIARGSAAARAAEYYKEHLSGQWRDAVGQALSAAARRDRDAALSAVMQIAAVKKIADGIRFDIAEAHAAEELLRFQP